MRKFLLIILLLSIFFALAGSIQAYQTIVKDYPELGGIKPQEGATLPQLIKYIFLFSLGIVGMVGMIAIIMGAFGYVTSAGNPQKAADAKNQIMSALLGILLLLGSAVLLNLVNPDLLRFKQEKLPGASVDIKPEEKEGCQYFQASLDKGQINAEESVILTLLRKNCKKEQYDKHKVLLEITQEVTGDNLWCRDIWINHKKIRITDAEFAIMLTFDKRCTDLDGIIPCGSLPNWAKAGKICNGKKGEVEAFYIKGEIEFEGGAIKYIPKMQLEVRDLDDENHCCK